jgi:hypothetical protein
MSSSRRNGHPTKKLKRFTPPATGWKCPTCGQKALIRVTSPFLLEEDGAVMPELDRLQCQSCKEDLFDLYAMDQITQFRKRHPYKKSMAKRPKADKKAIAA